jgi:hypothetical protein
MKTDTSALHVDSLWKPSMVHALGSWSPTAQVRRIAVVTWVLLMFAAMSFASDTQPENEVRQPFAAGGQIHMDLSSGGYTIRGGDTNEIVITYHASSQDQLRDIKAGVHVTGSIARVNITGTPHNNFRAEIEVPRQSALKVEMFAGEVIISDVTGDKDVHMTSGRLEIRIPDPDEYGPREASVTAGSIEATAFNVSKGGLFRSFEQSGHGKYRLKAHVTTGQIDLRGTN